MSYQEQPKNRKELIRRYHLLCECGHKNGRHWYAGENGTVSHDCRDCDCLNFILKKTGETMSTQSPLPQNDPMLIAFQKLKKTPEYQNAVKWTVKAENESQADGELWFGFAAGYAAAREIEIFQSYNEGIAWAADWLTGQAEANGDEIKVFALNIADSIRAHKKPWNAVNNDRCDACEHFHEMNETCGKCGKTWSGDTRPEEERNARY